MSAEEPLLVGRVARAHGNRGQVIVNPETDFVHDRFKVGRVLLVGGHSVPRRIRDVRFHMDRPIVGLEGVETMSDAEALAGAELRIAAGDVEPLPPGTHYRHDLIGCEVHDTHGEMIGRVVGVEGPMERSRLVVKGSRGEVLIPLVAEICVQVDPAGGRIIVQPPEGLLELNDTGR
ncbi:MAG TPA: ribosome maturation factor RimM [Vicinamibacterales bacterium]|nr:ribosome maturation factor RimM [Vicinamibacterales bacterium]